MFDPGRRGLVLNSRRQAVRFLSLVAFAIALALAWLMLMARPLNTYMVFAAGGGVVALVGAAIALWVNDQNSTSFKAGVVILTVGTGLACFAIFALGR